MGRPAAEPHIGIADPAGGKPTEPTREDQNENDTPKKLRYRDAEEGKGRYGVIEWAILRNGGDHAETDAQDRHQEEGGDRQQRRIIESLAKYGPDRSFHDQRIAEVTSQNARCPASILNI